jgi:hypothetical protein
MTIISLRKSAPEMEADSRAVVKQRNASRRLSVTDLTGLFKKCAGSPEKFPSRTRDSAIWRTWNTRTRTILMIPSVLGVLIQAYSESWTTIPACADQN